MRSTEFITELFDSPKPYPIQWYKHGREWTGTASDENERRVEISIEPLGEFTDAVSVVFTRNNRLNITGQGSALRIFTTVLQALYQYIQEHNPTYITFSADEPSRAKLYSAMAARLGKDYGYIQLDSTEYPEWAYAYRIGLKNVFILQKKI